MDFKDKLWQFIQHAATMYEKGTPIISDDLYDDLYDQLNTQKYDNNTKELVAHFVGESITPDDLTVGHVTRMYSLNKIYSAENFKKWVKSKCKEGFPTMYADLKLDGAAVELVYDTRGHLVYVCTRGNGVRGFPVKNSIVQRMNIPYEIEMAGGSEGLLSITGEAILSKKQFKHLQDRPLIGSRCNSARSTVAGILRSNEPPTADLQIDFFPYGVGGYTNRLFTHSDVYEGLMLRLEHLNFNTNPMHTTVHSEECAQVFFDKVMDERESLDYEIDGVVFKINDMKQQKKLGYTKRVPRHAIAWKFPPVSKVTKLVDIKYLIGRTGRVCPVAVVDPVNIGRAIFGSITLHSENRINELDLHYGDFVEVTLSGDVIPTITKSITELRDQDAEAIWPITECPYCQHPIIDESKLHRKCSNPDCSARKLAELEYQVGKHGYNIKGLGAKVLQVISTLEDVEDISDLFELSLEKFQHYLGQKTGNKVFLQIEHIKERQHG